MEKTVEGLGEILTGMAIRPPRLEDAGLEDCALPPESIMEAFSLAAHAIKSRITTTTEGEDGEGDGGGSGCVQDPGPSNGPIPDVLLGSFVGGGPERPCASAGVARGGDGARDEVVVVGAGDLEPATDRVLVLGGEEEKKGGKKKSCVVDGGDGLEGARGGEGKKSRDEEEDGLDDDDEKPRLVEGVI